MHTLTVNQYQDITGGESIWYWISYGIGHIAREIGEDIERMQQPGGYEWSAARPYG